MEQHPQQNEVCKLEITSIKDRVKDLEVKTKGLPVWETLLEQVIESNKIQGQALNQLNKTLDRVGNTMSDISKRQETSELAIQNLINERNINIVSWAKDNWFAIVLFAYVLYDSYQKLVP